MDFPIHIATLRMGLSIIYSRGYRYTFPNKYVLQSLIIVFIIANRAEPDETQHHAAFHLVLGLHCLPNYPLGVSIIHKVNAPLSDKFDQIMHLGPKVAPFCGSNVLHRLI